MALSDDLRKRVVEAVVLGGLSRNQAAAHFKVSVASAVRLVKRFTTTGEISPAPSGGDRRSGRIEAHRDGIVRVTAGRLRMAQHAETQAPVRPRERAIPSTRRNVFACKFHG